jgi:hypothetical protein
MGAIGGTEAGRAGAGGEGGSDECAGVTVELPWADPDTTFLEISFEIVALPNAVAVFARQMVSPILTVALVYALDGTLISSGGFEPETLIGRASDDLFLFVSHAPDGSIAAYHRDDHFETVASSGLIAGTTTERLRAAAYLGDDPVAITSERIVNLTTGASRAWSADLDQDAVDILTNGTIYGAGGTADQLLVAAGRQSTGQGLLLLRIDSSLNVASSRVEDYSGSNVPAATISAALAGDELVLFDGNPLRLSRIDGEPSVEAIGLHEELPTFYRTFSRVSAAPFRGGLVGFWYTSYPSPDNAQGSYVHSVYGCDLDLAEPAACTNRFLIDPTGHTGFTVAGQPLAAAQVAGDLYAVAYTDVNARAWLRIVDLGCEP